MGGGYARADDAVVAAARITALLLAALHGLFARALAKEGAQNPIAQQRLAHGRHGPGAGVRLAAGVYTLHRAGIPGPLHNACCGLRAKVVLALIPSALAALF